MALDSQLVPLDSQEVDLNRQEVALDSQLVTPDSQEVDLNSQEVALDKRVERQASDKNVANLTVEVKSVEGHSSVKSKAVFQRTKSSRNRDTTHSTPGKFILHYFFILNYVAIKKHYII